WTHFVEASGRLSAGGEGRLWIDDTPGLTPMQLRSKARRLHAQHGLDLVVVDYLQLMDVDGSKRYENRNAEVSYQSKAIKNLARELNVPVLIASQMSRAVEQRADKRPILSDLRDSGSIEQDADVVMFVYREDLYNPDTERKNVAEIIVAKHRKGPTGSVELYFRSHLTQFVNAARREIKL
ncbi:MAG: replicative DNA helicase, partial [Thermoflexales bacterium]|nr:replicative DNA helicase [Thermoflexales bacterium]